MKIRRVLKWSLVGLVVFVVVLRLAIPIGGVIVANRVLPGILGTDARIDYFSMVLVRGKAWMGHIYVGQPPGFEGDPLLKLDKIGVDIDWKSLTHGPLTIDSLTLDNLSVNLIYDKDNRLNVAQLAGSETNAPEDESSSSAPAVLVKEFNAHNVKFTYTDYTYSPPLVVDIEKAEIAVTNLLFDPSAVDNRAILSSMALTAVLRQADTNTPAYFGLTARTGVLGTGVPAVNALVRMSGFDLMTIKPLLAPGIIKTLGGTFVDINVDLAMAPDVLDCKAWVKSKSATMRLAIDGTPDNPQVDKSTALGNIITRPGAVIGSLLKDTGGAGMNAAKGVGKTIGAAGKGVGKVVKNVGTGAYRTVKGLVTLNFKGVKKGVTEATVGAAGSAAHTVGNTVGAAYGGVSGVGGSMSGQQRGDKWIAGSRARWEAAWLKAQRVVERMSYPQPEKKHSKEPSSK